MRVFVCCALCVYASVSERATFGWRQNTDKQKQAGREGTRAGGGRGLKDTRKDKTTNNNTKGKTTSKKREQGSGEDRRQKRSEEEHRSERRDENREMHQSTTLAPNQFALGVVTALTLS